MCALVFSGCVSISGGPEAVVDPKIEINTLLPMAGSEQVLAYFNEKDYDQRRVIRDQIVSARLYVSDINFASYTNDLVQELRGGAFGTDLVSLLLSGWASVAEPSQTTKVLAGLDTALKGGRQAFTKDLLIDRTLPVLIIQMQRDRSHIAEKIWSNLKRYSDETYPLPLALRHLDEYYQAGTIMGALMRLNNNVAFSVDKSLESSGLTPDSVGFISEGEALSHHLVHVEKSSVIDKDKPFHKVGDDVVVAPSAEQSRIYARILDTYVVDAKDENEEFARLGKIQSIIDSRSTDNSVSAVALINEGNANAKYASLQKVIIDELGLGEKEN